MENASKALIIAGAILISILLISVGIIIMNAINDPVEQGASAAEDQAVQIFNSQFTGYSGSNVDYNTAKQCITAVMSTKREGGHAIDLTGDITKASDLEKNSVYKIDFLDSDNNGYYDQCEINN